jgi:heat shock protein 4
VASVDIVEIVGGGMYMPSIQNKLKEKLGVELSKTLHIAESVARGCAVAAAVISPHYKVNEFAAQDCTLYPIGYNCCSLDMEVEAQPYQPLFTFKNVFPVLKVLTFNQAAPFVVNLGYMSLDGLPDGIAA